MNILGSEKRKKLFVGIISILSISFLLIVFLYVSEYISAENSLPTQEGVPELPKDALAAPAKGDVRSYFGPRVVMNNETEHLGIDIASLENESVYAVTSGNVSKVFSECTASGHIGSVCGNGYGNYIQIQHVIDGQEFETLYAHLGDISVREGETVNKNDQIGTIGSSGSSAGKALHFELHIPKKDVQNNAVDPLLYIPMK